MESIYQAMGLILIIGFCVQRLTDFVEPLIKKRVRNDLSSQTQMANHTVGNTESEIVTSQLQITSLFFASVIVISGNCATDGQIGLLFHLDLSGTSIYFRIVDVAVTILFLSAGTDGANSAIKYLSYVKDSRKYTAANQTSVEIVPAKVTVQQGQQAIFSAVVNNSMNQSVHWKVVHTNGGRIDRNGLYIAPSQAGTYTITAYSYANPSKIAKSEVTVV